MSANNLLLVRELPASGGFVAYDVFVDSAPRLRRPIFSAPDIRTAVELANLQLTLGDYEYGYCFELAPEVHASTH